MKAWRLPLALILFCGFCIAYGIVGCGDDDPKFGAIYLPECSVDVVHRLGDCTLSACANPYTSECYYRIEPGGNKFSCDDNCNCDDAEEEALDFMQENCFF
jgi:hypothetical protein